LRRVSERGVGNGWGVWRRNGRKLE
jgi:hypothetical protein